MTGKWLLGLTFCGLLQCLFSISRVRLKKMMKCIISRKQVKADDIAELSDSSLATRDHSASLYSSRDGEAEAKANTGNIEEAESTLRESGFLNYEEARALLGRLEYQKGNLEAAFHVFEGISIDVVTRNIKRSLARRCNPKKCNSQCDDAATMSMHAISLLFEAIFLKTKSLQALGRLKEAAQSCQVILDTVESAIPGGLNGRFSNNLKLHEILNKAVELLPELWKLSGASHEAISSYRRALLYNWDLELEAQTRIEKEFAVFLLYSGAEVNLLKLRFQAEGSFIPRNNIEEAILLLLILLKKFLQRKIEWDSSIMDHLSFALSISGDLGTLAHQLEELPVNIMDFREKHSTIALCYHGEEEDGTALNLLRNILNDRETVNCTHELLLASKICVTDKKCSEEGIKYGNQALKMLDGQCEQLRSNAKLFLGSLTSVQSRSVASDFKRVVMQSEAITMLDTAEKWTKGTDPNVIFHLGLEYAEQRKLETALSYAKKLLKLEAGSSTRGWILLTRILSAQKKYVDAENLVDAALEQTGKWDEAELLRTKAKLQNAQGLTKIAVKTYTHLLAVLQVRKKTFCIGKKLLNRRERDRALEMETWHDLANIYISLTQWEDAEACLSKSEDICAHYVSTLHSRGLLYEAKGLNNEAQKCFWEALDKNPTHIPSLISMAKSLMDQPGDQSLHLARSLARQAIFLDRNNHLAWYTLGLIHKLEPVGTSALEAIECFECAAILEETVPVEPFR